MSAQARGWGSGWPNCQRSKWKVLSWGGRLRLPVREAVMWVFAALIAELEAEPDGHLFRGDWSWGSACRPISGTQVPSNHSWGLAIDLDAPENPYMKAALHETPHSLRKTYPGGRVLRSTMPMRTEAIAKKWGMRWGGVYKTRPDPMHFEFMGTPKQAAIYTIGAKRYLGEAPVTSTPKPSVQEGGMFQRGDTHPEIAEYQRVMLGAGVYTGLVDGIFGKKTEAAVRLWQDRLDVPVTGEIDRATADATSRLMKFLSAQAESESSRTKDFQRLLGVPVTGTWDSATERACWNHRVGWRGHVDKSAHHVLLNQPRFVRWIQEQANRKFGYGYEVDGIVGQEVNHIIVIGLGQADGICGPSGYRETVK